jgi:hypothetical protein
VFGAFVLSVALVLKTLARHVYASIVASFVNISATRGGLALLTVAENRPTRSRSSGAGADEAEEDFCSSSSLPGQVLSDAVRFTGVW